MSVHNGDRFLAQAMESILNQSYEDLEFVVIDDGSADNTPAILEAYKRLDRRVRYFRQRDGGLGNALSLNKGSRLARGEYVAIMDADDVAFVDRLEKEVTFLDQHPKIALVGGAIAYIDQKGKPTGFIVRNPAKDREIKKTLLGGNCIAHPTAMIRKEAFHAVSGYRTAFLSAFDFDLFLRMAEQFEVANLQDCVLYYRIHPNQSSIRYPEEQALSAVAAQASAKVRRRTGRDPMDGVGRVTRDVLVKLGVTTEMVRIALLETYVWWTTHMLHSGYIQKALQLLRAGLNLDSSFMNTFAATYGYSFGPEAVGELRVLSGILPPRPGYISREVIGSFYLGCAKADYDRGRLLQGTRLMVNAYSQQLGLVFKSITWAYKYWRSRIWR
jgi:glycosyltransferase involved in cell wall biosynthesis